MADDTYHDGVEEFRTLFATMTDHEDSEGEDDGVLTIFYWFDDEPADEDELWATMYDGHDEYDGPIEAPNPVQRAASPSMQAPISETSEGESRNIVGIDGQDGHRERWPLVQPGDPLGRNEFEEGNAVVHGHGDAQGGHSVARQRAADASVEGDAIEQVKAEASPEIASEVSNDDERVGRNEAAGPPTPSS
jgi:hypothetical protein